jgi:hypothetical protein
MSSTTQTEHAQANGNSAENGATTDLQHSEEHHESNISRWMSPFSGSALALLPKNPYRRARYTRADAIPDADEDEEGRRPTVRDYHAINSVPEQVRVPKKLATPIKVEAKVWFANERSKFSILNRTHQFQLSSLAWISYLNVALLIGTLAIALFNASKDEVARNFAFIYAIISVGVLVSPVDQIFS